MTSRRSFIASLLALCVAPLAVGRRWLHLEPDYVMLHWFRAMRMHDSKVGTIEARWDCVYGDRLVEHQQMFRVAAGQEQIQLTKKISVGFTRSMFDQKSDFSFMDDFDNTLPALGDYKPFGWSTPPLKGAV